MQGPGLTLQPCSILRLLLLLLFGLLLFFKCFFGLLLLLLGLATLRLGLRLGHTALIEAVIATLLPVPLLALFGFLLSLFFLLLLVPITLRFFSFVIVGTVILSLFSIFFLLILIIGFALSFSQGWSSTGLLFLAGLPSLACLFLLLLLLQNSEIVLCATFHLNDSCI